MQSFEYTVVPAPVRGEKARGARTGAERFSYALTVLMNRMAGNGWEYIRAETLPCEERSGLTSRTTVYHNVLVFRRPVAAQATAPQPGPAERAPEPEPQPAAAARPVIALAAQQPAAPHEPPAYWPDGQADSRSDADASGVDGDGDFPAAPHDDPAAPAATADAPEAEGPPFTQRPPLSALRAPVPAPAPAPASGVFSEPMQVKGTGRLGPAER